MKKILIVWLLLAANTSYAQIDLSFTDDPAINDALNTIVTNLTVDPENPLDINSDFLGLVVNQLPEGTLKSTLLSYDLTSMDTATMNYRQLYWDLAAAFDQNSALAGLDQFNQTILELNLILDHPEQIAYGFKNNIANYNLGTFMNDETFVTDLTQITGSYEGAQLTAMGIDIVLDIFAGVEESQKFKTDYLKLAKLSGELVYAEKDIELSKALIDAEVGIEQHQMLTSLYRYDFENGASLRVEDGILKYINVSKKIKIDLAKVEKRHDGGFYKRVIGMFGIGERAYETAISIKNDESIFYLYTGANVFQDSPCTNCHPEKKGILFDASTGEIISSMNHFAMTPNNADVNDLFFSGDTIKIRRFSSDFTFYTSTWSYTYKDKKLKMAPLLNFNNMDPAKKFLINGSYVPFNRDYCSPYSETKNFYAFDKGNLSIHLFWGEDYDPAYMGPTGSVKPTPRHHSSLLQISRTHAPKQKDYFNTDGMVNELTGMAMHTNGDLFFVNKAGNLGKISNNDIRLEDALFTNQIRNCFTKKLFAAYDFNAEKKYLSIHGELSYTHSSIFPSLNFTPDYKWLVYIVNDHLYIVDPTNFNNVKSFQLTFEPYHCFFGKENGDYTLFVLGLNDFKFPITKKYSLAKLTATK